MSISAQSVRKSLLRTVLRFLLGASLLLISCNMPNRVGDVVRAALPRRTPSGATQTVTAVVQRPDTVTPALPTATPTKPHRTPRATPKRNKTATARAEAATAEAGLSTPTPGLDGAVTEPVPQSSSSLPAPTINAETGSPVPELTQQPAASSSAQTPATGKSTISATDLPAGLQTTVTAALTSQTPGSPTGTLTPDSASPDLADTGSATPEAVIVFPTPTPAAATFTQGILTNGQDSWQLTSVEFVPYISINGHLYYPAVARKTGPERSYRFMRLNFDCTSGKSLITQYAGMDMGLTYINRPLGYSDVFINDYQGRSFLSTLIGACWLAVPVPYQRLQESRFSLHFQSFPPLDLGFLGGPSSQNIPIVYASDQDDDVEIYLYRMDVGLSNRLTFQTGRDFEPAWFPDYSQVIYAGEHGGLADLYQVSISGGKPMNLTNTPDREEGAPAYAPSGDRLAYHARSTGRWQIYVLDSTGREVALTGDTSDARYPSWSSDSTQIVYQSNEGGDWDLMLIDSDGQNARPLTTWTGDEILPAWSPDGTQIVFWANQDGRWILYRISPQGGEAIPLTQFENPGLSPSRAAWSPDSMRLTLALQRLESLDLFVMNADGSDPRRLTDNNWDDFDPAW
jgi:hypothetical protein